MSPLTARFSAICLELGLEEQERWGGNVPENSNASTAMAESLRLDLLLERINLLAAELIDRPEDREYALKKIWWLSSMAQEVLLRREAAALMAIESAMANDRQTANKVSCMVHLIDGLDKAKAIPDELLQETDMTSLAIAFFEGNL